MTSSTDVELIAARCQQGGLDLHAATSVGRYNALVPAEFHLPGHEDWLVVVIGNTRALWPHIDRFVIESSEPVSDPVDEYVEHVVRQAVAEVDGVVDIRFSHEPPPRRVAIQQLAHVAGLAWLSPSHLCVHSTFGPWIALRAAVVLNASAPAPIAELMPPCDCASHCLPKLQQALDAGEATSDDVIEHWRLWVAMRDACPVGHEHRYSGEQIAYHYIGERPARWG